MKFYHYSSQLTIFDDIWQHSQVHRGGQNILRIDSNLLHTISRRRDKCNTIARPNDRNCTAVIVYTIRELSHGMRVTASTDLVHIQREQTEHLGKISGFELGYILCCQILFGRTDAPASK